jgi:hypothetical protein
MSRTPLVALAISGLGLFAASSAPAATLLDVDFESGYTLGTLKGQSGGTSGGPWTTETPETGSYQVVGAFPGQGSTSLGSKAVTLNRDGFGYASVPYNGYMDMFASTPTNNYMALDFLRGDDNDQGAFWPYNTAVGTATYTGLGAYIDPGANPTLKYYKKSGDFLTYDTGFVLENNKWHRLEWEITSANTGGLYAVDDAARTFDLYIQKEGIAGRTLLANDVQWYSTWQINDAVHWFPQGGPESVMLLDNLVVQSNVNFAAINRPLDASVPEPGSLSLAVFAGVGLLSRRRRQRSR